ncbi:MAG: UbiA family prenyltransferase [Pirellulaceae bacterium]|nr:UbiA family prenyltransferase [Pirellulaceae bacterium]
MSESDQLPQKSFTSPPATALDYMRLCRIPNVFTAVADVLMGFIVVHQSFAPMGPLACLVIASALLYTAGMILNDVFDIEVDRAERPHRPLPSGKISLSWARSLGFGMLLGGVGFGFLAAFVQPVEHVMPWRSGAIATCLAGSVVLYDALLKKTPLGPIGMGACRFWNVLLGMSVAASDVAHGGILGFGPHHLAAAGGIGVYIVGVTWFARNEARASNRWQLSLALMVAITGIGLLGFIHSEIRACEEVTSKIAQEGTWYMLLGLVALPVLRRAAFAISDPRPEQVQLAVKSAILSLIVIDAFICLDVADYAFSIPVILLLIPTLLLGRYVYST